MAYMSARHRVAILAALLIASVSTSPSQAQKSKDWQTTFNVDKKNLGVKGSNPYFNLTPGYQLSYQHGKETDVVTVLDQTKLIDGVMARALEDREYNKEGKLVERTLDYYAIDSVSNDVYYMGEDVDEYDKNGKVTGHEGSWLSGVKGAKFGLMMPARPQVGQKFYQEQAPGVAMDRVEVVSVTETISVPDGRYTSVVHLVETTPLELGKAHKLYASGVGLVKDDDFELVKHGLK